MPLTAKLSIPASSPVSRSRTGETHRSLGPSPIAVSSRSANVDVRIRLVLRIIEERAGALDISAKQMGGLFGLGEARLLRLFSCEVGKSYRRYLREVRMAQAAEMLTNYALPIKTIAARYGYSAVSNFHRDFKIVHGISPMRMRLLKMGRSTTTGEMDPGFPAGSGTWLI